MKLYLRTFGCRANQYDSEAVRAMVDAAGATIVDAPEDADVAVFNSCAVTADAEADLGSRCAARRDAARRLHSVVMGCASALPGDVAATLAALPAVRALVPGADLDGLAEALGLPAARVATDDVAKPARERCCASRTAATSTAPSARRRWRAARTGRRAADALVDEARALAEHHAEIVLTGSAHRQLGHGASAARSARSSSGSCATCPTCASASRPSRRRRSTTGWPSCSSVRRAASRRICTRRCNRDRTACSAGWDATGTPSSDYAAAVERLVARAPIFALGADVITGFPGRDATTITRMTVALVRALPFTSLHVFPYSERPGTAAARLPEPVAPARGRRTRARSCAASPPTRRRRIGAARVGGEADVVVIRQGAIARGLTEDYLDVSLGAGAPPRAARFRATLVARGGELRAEALEPVAR